MVFEDLGFRIVRVDLRRDLLELHWKDSSGKPFGDVEALRAWGQVQGRRLAFATNAGIYDRNFAPLGLYVEDGRQRVPLNLARGNPASGNFSLLPNGVFAVDAQGKAHVMTSQAWKAAALPTPRLATQSGPMLLIDGSVNPAFTDASESMKWRSGVCAVSGDEVVFAVSESPVNFHVFARLFRDRLQCRDALFLDGTISQAYVDGQGYVGAPPFMLKPYAGIFAVFDKAP
ncbi:MAG TPA: phosphodiester glycosidase family protein [Pinirhizobacter sp.]